MNVIRTEFKVLNPALGVRRSGIGVPGVVVAPEHASLMTKAKRLRQELGRWLKAGAVLVPREVRQERQAICAACEFWRAAGNFGLGECGYPGCGCTRVKAALATSRCPQTPPKWGPWEPK